jgi:hypothetical protein
MRAPDVPQLLAELDRAERVLPPARRYHYSNLAVALLGQVVATRRGGTWAEALTGRILDPLGLSDTTVDRPSQAATGYLVDAYSDHARPEPAKDFGAVGPAAQLWSSAADMARWAAFLADPASVDPTGAVLAPGTVDEMRWPLTVTDETLWTVGFGLGLILVPQGGACPTLRHGPRDDRIVHVGHDGAMPGFLAAVYGRRGGRDTPAGLGAAVLASSGTADAILELPHELLAAAVEHDPADIAPWAPGDPAPQQYRSALGRWWGEGFEFVFTWRDGALTARGERDPAGRPPSVFTPLGDDLFRTASGREAGELLRLTRDASGQVVRMHWATYRFTRIQETFDGVWVSEP